MHHTLEWREGYEAYGEGANINANPYQIDTDESDEWRDGYCEARYDDV